jgi:hypothetical protein
MGRQRGTGVGGGPSLEEPKPSAARAAGKKSRPQVAAGKGG